MKKWKSLCFPYTFYKACRAHSIGTGKVVQEVLFTYVFSFKRSCSTIHFGSSLKWVYTFRIAFTEVSKVFIR